MRLEDSSSLKVTPRVLLLQIPRDARMHQATESSPTGAGDIIWTASDLLGAPVVSSLRTCLRAARTSCNSNCIMASGQRTNTDYWPQVVRFKDIIIRIWHHTISCQHGESNIPYWTYVSYGMSTVNQPDLVVTLRRRLSESEGNYSIEPLSWFKMVYLWGKKGRKIDVYHTQEAHFDHWLGSKKLETVTYGMPIQLPGFGPGVLPHNRVHGIALTSQESELAKLFGYTRVVGHLGWGVRWFPYPPWIDRDRDDSIVRAQTDKTIRRDFFPVFKKIKGTSARREGSRIILEFLPNSEDAVLSAIPDSTAEAVAFDSHLHPNATACYTWQKGNKDMMLYGYRSAVANIATSDLL